MSMEHNIFKYATSELSQDAAICWLLSFYNNKDSKLYSLATPLIFNGTRAGIGFAATALIRQSSPAS